MNGGKIVRISSNQNFALYNELSFNKAHNEKTDKAVQIDKTADKTKEATESTSTNNTIETQKTDNLTSTSLTSSTLDPAFVEEIIARAKQGAHDCVYMSEEFHEFANTYKLENVSPDRSIIPSAFENILSFYDNQLPSIFDLLGTPYTASAVPGMATFYENGEAIMTYSETGGFSPQQTQAEGKFYDESKEIYFKAYTEERARMKAEDIPDATGNVPGTSVNGITRL